MEAEYNRLRDIATRAYNQEIGFDKRSVVGISFIADAHIGHYGVNHARLLAETQAVCATRGLYLFCIGDMIENKIVAKLVSARWNNETQPQKEWVVLKHWLTLAAPKLIGTCEGNHDGWLAALTGVDFMRDVVARAAPQSLFAGDDVRFAVNVNGTRHIVRSRHKWRYRSIFNATHGIERTFSFDGNFDVGIGAHYHQGAQVRESTFGGRTILAAVCGSYKEFDEYAIKCGFPTRGQDAIVTIFFRDDGKRIGFSNLPMAIEYANRVCK